MGAAPKMQYPKWVWSPAGGPYCETPKNWQRNSFIVFSLAGVAIFCIARYSASLERRPIPPVRPILSQRWSKYAAVDDPSVRERVH